MVRPNDGSLAKSSHCGRFEQCRRLAGEAGAKSMRVDGSGAIEVALAERAEPFQADAAIDFEHRKSGARSDNIDRGETQAEHAGRPQGHAAQWLAKPRI